ncbi:J domain-containing protein [Phenylobacterium sp.]|uniref:J domain-containing protein n=1 Tax=Phenylobacterium sp. TaxID=1871053 RepID=UPI002D105349|nr:J domain-containing protein [Phenylobacterium sp.]HLZ75614.1 J domain-containing protein [Phenylobacterium sp.]
MSRQDPNGYYRLLGLAPDCAQDEIARAFRTLAKACHPDRNPDPAAAARFKLLSEAYATLSTAQGRAAYDRDPFARTEATASPRARMMGQIALGVAAPVIAVGIWFQGQSVGALNAARPPPPGASPAASEAQAQPEAPAAPTAVRAIPAAALCAHPPADGALIEGAVAQSAFGHHLEITNGSEGASIIKLRDAHSGRARLAFFVSKGGHAKVGPLPDGDYHIQYAIGADLAEDCRSFVAIDRAAEFPDPDRLQTQYRDGGVVTQTLSYVLYNAPSGNVRAQTIDPQKFLTE